MQIDLSQSAGVCAIIMLGVHVIVYANKEGKKEQRLRIVEDKVKTLEPLATQMATLTASVSGLDKKLDDFKNDLRSDIGDLRSYLMSRQG